MTDTPAPLPAESEGDTIPQNGPTAPGRGAAPAFPAVVFRVLFLLAARLSAAFDGSPTSRTCAGAGHPAEVVNAYAGSRRPLEYPYRRPNSEVRGREIDAALTEIGGLVVSWGEPGARRRGLGSCWGSDP